MNSADKDWAHFWKIKYFKKENFKKEITKRKNSLKRFDQFSTLENDFENQNVEEVVHNFGKSDGGII